MNNDAAEQPQIHASGMLPMRRPPPYPDLSPRDPAVHAMTDFTDKCPITVAPERPIDEALSDIVRREYIRVVDIMTEWDDVPTVDWTTMQSARITDLLEIFYGIGVMHLLVVEGEQGSGAATVRGLVSRTRIERRLNRPS